MQLSKWCHNVIVAFSYQEKKHYIVHDGAINPVDYNNTGIVQNSTNWSDGLHQLLQIKHKLKLTSETLTTNFLSNVGYFKKYGPNLFRLSGTLGSLKARELLSDVFNLDYILIPPQRQKQYLQFPTVVMSSQKKWLNEICESGITEANKGRATLIICETIEHAHLLEAHLQKKHPLGATKMYTMNNMNQEQTIEKVNQGEIIIATNLAGRGTDIKTDEIEEYGGLHVILTSLPPNKRVEEQAFGRTARQGKRGTGQMILNSVDLMERFGSDDPTKIEKLRDESESETLEEFKKSDLKLIMVKDELFSKFCVLLNKIRTAIRSKISANKSNLQQFEERGILSTLFQTNSSFMVCETSILNAIEEQWAIFLRQIDDGIIKPEEAEDRYGEFNSLIEADFQSEKVIKNPYFHIAIANSLLSTNNEKLREETYENIMQHLNRAIELDERFSGAAYASRAWLLLKGKTRFWVSHEHTESYKNQAVCDFQKAVEYLREEMTSLQGMLVMSQPQNLEIDSDLSKQLTQKISILGSYLNSLESAVAAIKKGQRLLDIKCVRQSESHTSAQYVETFHCVERHRAHAVLNDGHKFELTYNDLTVRHDCGERDQAIETLKRNESKIDENVAVCIDLKKVDIQTFQTMLNQDIEIKGVSKSTAISRLKEKKQKIFTESKNISFTIVSNLEVKNNIRNSNASNAIDFIERYSMMHGDGILIDLTFRDANKVALELRQKILSETNLSIEYNGLDKDNATKTLSKITCKEHSIEISELNDPGSIRRIIENEKVQSQIKLINFITREVQSGKIITETLDFSTAKKKVHDLIENYAKRGPNPCDELIQRRDMTLKFENLDQNAAGTLIELCDDNIIDIKFIGITIPKSDLSEGQVNISFAELNPKTGAILISLLRKENIDFGLTFTNLNEKQIKEIIETNPTDQEDIEITQVKLLSELFTNDMRPTQELSEFAARGIEYLLEVNEKRFIPWRSIACVGALAATQMALGGVLVATGFGANVGMGLITEGVADLVTAARIYNSRQFTWSDYAKQKAVSLVISATCLGWQKIKDAGKGLKNIVTGLKQEALEQAGTQLVSNGKMISKTLVQTGKNLKSLALKQIGVTAGETVVRTGLNKIADSLSHFGLEQFKPKISAAIQHHVEARFRESVLMHLIRKMYALEVITVNSNKSQTNSIPMQGLKDKIDKMVTNIIHPKNDFWRKQWDSIGGPLCQGILSDPKYLGSSFSMSMRIVGILNGMTTISTMVDNVRDQLLHKLSLKNKEEFQMNQLLVKYCHLDQNDAKQISEILKQHNVICTETQAKIINFETLNLQAFEGSKAAISQISFGCAPNDQRVVTEFLKSLYKYIVSMEMDQLSQIIKSVSDMITSQILSVTESQLISPLSSYAMGALTSSISSSLQDKLIKKELENDIISDTTRLQELKSKNHKTAEDINLVNELTTNLNENYSLRNQNQTYSNLVNYNAKQYTIARNQCETIYYAQQQEADKKRFKINSMRGNEVQAYAEKIRKPGGNPANAADMLAMAAKNGIKLKIIDNANYQLTAAEKAQGIHIVVFSKGEQDQNGTHGLGHYQLLNSDGVLADIQSNYNDCGFAVMAKLTGKSIEGLRVEHANYVEYNAASFAESLEAQNWIMSRYPQEVNTLLFKGAGTKNDLVKQELNHKFEKKAEEIIESTMEKFSKLSKEEQEKGVEIEFDLEPPVYLANLMREKKLILIIKKTDENKQCLNVIVKEQTNYQEPRCSDFLEPEWIKNQKQTIYEIITTCDRNGKPSKIEITSSTDFRSKEYDGISTKLDSLNDSVGRCYKNDEQTNQLQLVNSTQQQSQRNEQDYGIGSSTKSKEQKKSENIDGTTVEELKERESKSYNLLLLKGSKFSERKNITKITDTTKEETISTETGKKFSVSLPKIISQLAFGIPIGIGYQKEENKDSIEQTKENLKTGEKETTRKETNEANSSALTIDYGKFKGKFSQNEKRKNDQVTESGFAAKAEIDKLCALKFSQNKKMENNKVTESTTSVKGGIDEIVEVVIKHKNFGNNQSLTKISAAYETDLLSSQFLSSLKEKGVKLERKDKVQLVINEKGQQELRTFQENKLGIEFDPVKIETSQKTKNGELKENQISVQLTVPITGKTNAELEVSANDKGDFDANVKLQENQQDKSKYQGDRNDPPKKENPPSNIAKKKPKQKSMISQQA